MGTKHIFRAALFCVLPALFVFHAAAQTAAMPTEQYDVSGGPVTFEFKYQKGDHYRILSTVNEDVFVNMRLDHHAVIVNRIAAEVTDTDGKGGATHDATFMTSEDSTGSLTGAKFSYGEEYHSVFSRDARGIYTISDEFFMPTVRDVPTFPEGPVKPGDTWTASGHEAHDMRRQFGMQAPYKVPFTATYTYLGTVSREASGVKGASAADAAAGGRRVDGGSSASRLHVFNVSYTLYAETPLPSKEFASSDYPVLMMGYSDELVYWDAEKGAIDHYTERFRIIMESSFGYIYEFRGTAHSEVTEFERAGTDDNVAAVQKQLEDLGLENVTVQKSDMGLTLSIENIQFKAESAVLLDSEKAKLDQLAQILSAYPDNDILVSGHTAKSRGGKDPQQLSEDRAQTVADYLISLGVKDRYHIFTQGFGDTKPVAPNSTKEGMAKNRRVEITIMDK
ncbi:MAG TPA: OmpA family protein [Treponema sp.]|nr:OmpA family protein [Treponema sp.]